MKAQDLHGHHRALAVVQRAEEGLDEGLDAVDGVAGDVEDAVVLPPGR
jgi:hypothetical protein